MASLAEAEAIPDSIINPVEVDVKSYDTCAHACAVCSQS